MRVKEASILDFLSVPQKVSSTVYEVMAKEATDAYVKSKTDPNQTIAKIASEKGLNPDQIHRVVELTNHSINSSLSKEASDQLFTFPVSTVESVMTLMGVGKQKVASDGVEKVAEVDDPGIYSAIRDLPDYVDQLAAKRFGKLASAPTAQKTASSEETVLPEHIQQKLASENLKRAQGDLHYAEMNLRSSLAEVRSAWEKVAESDREEFLYGAAHVLGLDDTRALAKVIGSEAEKVAEFLDTGVLQKLSSYVNEGHDALAVFSRFKSSSEEYKQASDAFLRIEKSAGLGLSVIYREPASRALRGLGSVVPQSITSKPVRRLAAGATAGAGVAKALGGSPTTGALTAAKFLTPAGALGRAVETAKETARNVRDYQ